MDSTLNDFEPKIIDAIVWICLRNKQVLCARTRGKAVFYMPGGKREKGESDWEALRREIQEELNVALLQETVNELMTVQDIAHGYSELTQVRMKCFQAKHSGEIMPNSEIEEIAWFNFADLHRCAPAAQRVLGGLLQRQLID